MTLAVLCLSAVASVCYSLVSPNLAPEKKKQTPSHAEEHLVACAVHWVHGSCDGMGTKYHPCTHTCSATCCGLSELSTAQYPKKEEEDGEQNQHVMFLICCVLG